jgi:hypothetical protein
MRGAHITQCEEIVDVAPTQGNPPEFAHGGQWVVDEHIALVAGIGVV